MAVPGFQELMLPALRAVEDGKTYTNAQVNERVAEALSLTADDMAEMLPSGRSKLFYNRCGWAKQYLISALCLTHPKRALYTITDRGREVLAAHPEALTVADLKQFPELEEFLKPTKPQVTGTVGPEKAGTGDVDPIEMVESGYQQMRDQLAKSVLEQVAESSPEFFEQLVVDLLVAMGYGGSRADAGQAVGGSSDGGIDGVIKEDRLGLDAVYIQAKRWANVVGRPVVQGFAGALDGKKARRGVFIRTSGFTKEALEYAALVEKGIVLVDGPTLAELMIDYGVGVTEVASYTVKRLDADYFEGGGISA
jgi:restriction system protein